MSGPSERDIRREVDGLRDDGAAPAAADGVTVAWRDAAPAERPDGMAYADGDDDTPATLTYDLWRAQREFRDALADPSTDLAAFLAGYGSGKSVTGARWLLAQAIEHPGSRFLAMGVSFSEARGSTFQTLFEELPGEHTHRVTSSYNGPENSPLVDDYNRAEHRITLTNGSEITLGSADKWSRYAGAQFGGIWMDEPSHYGDDLHDLLEMMGSRLRGVAGPHVIAMTLTGNGYNAAWEILAKRQDSTGEPLGIEIELVRASTLENPYIDDATKERFKRQYEGSDREEQALHGGFEAATGLVYSNFSRETHVIPHDEARERVVDEWRVYGYDAGWRDPRVLLEVGKTPAEQLVVVDEFHERGAHVEDVVGWLTENEKPRGTIYAEHEPSDIEKLKRAGWPVEKAEKSLDAGISEVRRRLEADGNAPAKESGGSAFVLSYTTASTAPRDAGRRQRGRGATMGGGATTADDTDADADADADADDEGRVGLLVSDNCQHLIREFLGYKEDHVGTSQAVDHCLDATRYLCMGVAG